MHRKGVPVLAIKDQLRHTSSKITESFYIGSDLNYQREMVEKLINLNLELRQEMRRQKNWTLADQIRDRLKEIGIVLEDRADGATGWSKEK